MEFNKLPKTTQNAIIVDYLEEGITSKEFMQEVVNNVDFLHYPIEMPNGRLVLGVSKDRSLFFVDDKNYDLDNDGRFGYCAQLTLKNS